MTGNKTEYFNESFDTVEEAVAAAAELLAAGYDHAHIRDTEGENELW